MNPLQPFLDEFGVVILDGGLASELESRGADLDDPLWSAKFLFDNPDLIRQVHADYFVAGADVAISASYQATFGGFTGRGLDAAQSAGLMRRSVQLALEARDWFWSEPTRRAGRLRPIVAASIGCYGASLHDGSEYRGDYSRTRKELEDFHRPRLEILAASGADLLACETIPCRIEGEALIHVLEEFPDVSAWISFSCRDNEHVCHGERLADCIADVSACPRVIAAGLNCTPPRFVSALLASITAVTDKPLVVYPNKGEVWDSLSRSWQKSLGPAVNWAEAGRNWYAAGARLIGGCCRTTPEDIRWLALELRHGRAGSTPLGVHQGLPPQS